MRLVFTTDWHLCSKKPFRRTDSDFLEVQLKKVDEIINYCIDTKVDVVIHGGDVFDVPVPDYWLLNEVVPRLRKLRRAKIPCYIVYGSHDMFGYNIKSIGRDTGVGTLLHAGLFRSLIGPMEIYGVPFHGIPAMLYHTVDVYKNITKKTIIVTHNMVVPEFLPFEHVLFDDLRFCLGNVFLCGHYHKVFFIKKKQNVFVNTGPLVRTDKREADHTPNFILLEYGTKLKISRVPISCKPASFDFSERTEGLPNFIETLQLTHFNFLDLFDLTRKVAQQEDITEPILTEALDRLHKAQQVIYGN